MATVISQSATTSSQNHVSLEQSVQIYWWGLIWSFLEALRDLFHRCRFHFVSWINSPLCLTKWSSMSLMGAVQGPYLCFLFCFERLLAYFGLFLINLYHFLLHSHPTHLSMPFRPSKSPKIPYSPQFHSHLSIPNSTPKKASLSP